MPYAITDDPHSVEPLGGIGLLEVDVAVEDDEVLEGDDEELDDALDDELDDELDDPVDDVEDDVGKGSVGMPGVGTEVGRADAWSARPSTVCGDVLVLRGTASATVAIIASAAVRAIKRPGRNGRRGIRDLR